MAEHHSCVETYATPGDVRAHFERLHEAGAKAVRLLAPVESAAVFSELLRQARAQEIKIAALHTVRGEFLVGATQALTRSLAPRHTGADPLGVPQKPLDTVVFDLRLDAEHGAQDALATVRLCASGIDWLRREHEVAFHAVLCFTSLDATALEALVEHLVQSGFDKITLRCALEEASPADLGHIRDQLATFCRRPIAAHSSLRADELPFCLLPTENFRWAYRELHEQIPGQAHLFRQRSLVATLREAEHRYHAPCRQCRRRAACYGLTSIGDHPQHAEQLLPSHETSVVFAGASLTADDVREHEADDLVFTGPARQGDAIMAILEGFETILLLDGYFFQSYALTTFEVLLALLENINVFGASSLGAVRALELGNYGMRGQGYVYQFFQSHAVAPYHAVAQTYDASDQAISEPLVAVHRFLEVAVAEGVVSQEDGTRCYTIAEQLHFSEITYKYLFAVWRRSDALATGTSAGLQALYEERGRLAFDVKRQDALGLLASFRQTIKGDGPQYSIRTVEHARDTYLARIRAKYEDGYDSSLATDWNAASSGGSATGRTRPVADTLALARAFFSDLDVVVADTSLLDATEYYMVNVVFVPFFFLSYGNSSGSGFGETMEGALVSAYAEVLERIPCGTLRTTYATAAQTQAPVADFRKLPFYASMRPDKLRFFTDETQQLRDDAYVECTDLLRDSGDDTFALPAHGARLPSSCGMAAGNTPLEAILYGLYEVIEHDVSAGYETRGLLRELRHLNIGLDAIEDPALASLIADLSSRGHRIHFFLLANRYNLPVVLSAFYDADRRLLFSGQCCRCDLQSAMAHAFHEALNGHFVSYFGSRDDRQGFEQTSADPGRFLDALVAPPTTALRVESAVPRTLREQLDLLLDRLREHDIQHVFALDLSPSSQHGLATAKVIVPGLELRTASHRGPAFYRRCEATRRAIAGAVGSGARDAMPPLADLRQTYGRSHQRFFKA